MRAFLAIFPPKEVTATFRDFKQQLRKQKQNIRFVPAPDVHLSMKFLGPDVPNRTIEELTDVFRGHIANIGTFELTIAKVQFGFPNDPRPRTLIITFEPSEALDNLQREIEAWTPGRKYPMLYPPRKKFVPHMTLGRIHGNVHTKKIREIEEAIERAIFNGTGMKFSVDKLQLINSIKVKDGQRYEIIAGFPLKIMS